MTLKVIIAGAGIGGLGTAIALRKQGHTVEIYEQARLAKELGFGLHIAPNGISILKRLGLNVEDGGAIIMKKVRYIKHTGEIMSIDDRTKSAGRWENEWYMGHRARLHHQLKELATDPDGEGQPATIHTSSSIRSVDPHKGTMELADGTVVEGDVIIGADGLHSKSRASICDPPITAYQGKHSAFRFALDTKDLLDDPITHDHFAEGSNMDMFYSPDCKIVLYPTLDNTLLNAVVIHPAEKSEGIKNAKSAMMEICNDFGPLPKAIIQKADPENLKVWPLFDMDTLPTFVNDRLAVIGDAAHPFTPHLAQGAIQALEDGVSLGVMLERGTTPDQVPSRLAMFNQARYERGTLIQKRSLLVGDDTISEDQTDDSGLKGKCS